MQPKIGAWGVHFPSTCSFCRLLTRSRWAGVRAARHKPSHSPVSAQTRPASRVGILQIGFGNSPAGPPASTGLFAAKLRARYFQVRSAQFGWHRVLWIANGDPLVARTGPVSGRLGESCAAGPKQHHQYDTQAGCMVRSFSEFPVWAVLSHARAWLTPTPVDIIEN
jgi:hypothetical protein